MPLVPPRKPSEVKPWIAAHSDDPRAFDALAWAAKRPFSTHDACIRALMTIGGTAALEALSTYRGKEAGNKADLGAAWDRFDRHEFARRVLESPVVLSARGGLARIDGIDAVEELIDLSIETADGCSLEPLTRCPDLINLEIMARGDLDLSPVASLHHLDLLTVLDGSRVGTFDSLRGAQARKLKINAAASIGLGFLATLPRLRRVEIATPRATLDEPDRAVLRALIAKGVAIRGYSHEAWSAALGEIGGTFREERGFRAVAAEAPSARMSNFLSG